ncbi:hypothetical protein DFJ58DRAFT_727438 [Suillus subalutaceus]|uniref:uncharacterized protein n=1 Tax=Suillus subalutaceus TaxID=48586 RepID=UPI001B8701D7|nr:uncharacterized protein DFJ58DRAFT_727438 [Suillus subalutaceus]KAG1855626.1 hypothetical protein DFJ58DRAFT_727438 [Suillus subalutaceus]
MHDDGELSDITQPSTVSLPLDTPEIDQRVLEQDQEESEQEVLQQLADDKESLSGAPGPISITLLRFDNEENEEAENLQFPPVEPPNPPREPPLPPALTPVKPRATQATVPLHKLISLYIKPPIVTPTNTAYEATKVAIFGTLISAGSHTDLWWMNLDAKHKASWSTVRTAFIAKWPAIIAAGKTKLEYQKELLALCMKDEEIGQCITVAGIETWSHVHFHGTLKKLVQDAGVDSAPILIQPVCDVLPWTLRDLTSPAPPDWDTFFDEIKDTNINTLLEKVK